MKLNNRISFFSFSLQSPLPDFDERGRSTLTDINIQYQEIADVISLLNTNTAVGPNRISNRMLKEVMHEVAHSLCLLFNKSLQECKFPRAWKLVHVIPIFKNGHKPLVSNYRHITLLYSFSTTLWKVAYTYIFSFLFGNPIHINSSQNLYLFTTRHTN